MIDSILGTVTIIACLLSLCFIVRSYENVKELEAYKELGTPEELEEKLEKLKKFEEIEEYAF